MAQKTIDFENDILRPIGSLKEDLAYLKDNKITKFYTNNNGDTVLNDSDDGKIYDLIIYGKSEQKQYKGTNLLGNVTKNTQTVFGVTVTPQVDGSFLLNGTTTKDFADIYLVGTYGTTILGTLDSTKKYFVRGSGNDNIKVIFGMRGNVKNIGASGAVIDGIDYAFFYLQIPTSGTTLNNVVIYPQINEGKTVLDYEPYTGGKPSPSPEYPQEIKSVVNPVIKVHGANILDIKDVAERVDNNSGLTYSVQKGTIKIKGTSNQTTGFAVPFLYGTHKKLIANKTYIFNPNPTKKAEGNTCYLDFTNNINLGMSITNNNVDKPINITDAQALYEYVLSIKVQKGAQIDMEWKPQLLLSNTLLPYRPYSEQIATLPYELNAIPVSSGGNVTIDGQQYIADYVDIEKGVLVRNMACGNILDMFYIAGINEGDAKWWDSSVSDMVDMRQNSGYKFSDGATIGLFSKLKSYQFNNFYNKKIAMGIMNSQNYLMINMPKSYGLTTKQKWEDFLRDGKILKQLETSVEINLTQDHIEAFKALSTYYPKTYINAESEQLEAYTMFNYPVSMEKGWEYVKQQIGDTRKYVYDMDLQSAEAYVNSEYAVALTELEV